MGLYLIGNGPMPTTAAFQKVASGTSILTLLQVKPGATVLARIVEWGISFDGASAVTPVQVGLIETDVAATVTAAVAADLMKYDADALNAGDPTTALFSVGVSATGYTASVEGSTTSVRVFDMQLLPPTGPYVKQFPLGREPVIQPGKFARIRITAGATVNCTAYMIVSV